MNRYLQNLVISLEKAKNPRLLASIILRITDYVSHRLSDDEKFVLYSMISHHCSIASIALATDEQGIAIPERVMKYEETVREAEFWKGVELITDTEILEKNKINDATYLVKAVGSIEHEPYTIIIDKRGYRVTIERIPSWDIYEIRRRNSGDGGEVCG